MFNQTDNPPTGADDKVDSFVNTYTTYDLTITKNVTGVMGDKSKDFTFTIVLDDPDNGNHMNFVHYTVTGEAEQTAYFTNGQATIEVDMKHDESVVIKGLPVGTAYTITESDNDGYTVTYTGATTNGSGTMAAQDAEVTVNNNRETIPATGVIMNVAPYALMVVVAVAAGVVFLGKRRED